MHLYQWGPWDRTWVSDKTNSVYCRHDEKARRIRTDASPFTHGAVLPLNAFSLFFQVRVQTVLRGKSHSDRVTQILDTSGAFASLHTRVLLCTPLWRTDSLTRAVILFALWLHGPLRAAAAAAAVVVVVAVVCAKHQSRSVKAAR